jgi:hypothetical protein
LNYKRNNNIYNTYYYIKKIDVRLGVDVSRSNIGLDTDVPRPNVGLEAVASRPSMVLGGDESMTNMEVVCLGA